MKTLEELSDQELSEAFAVEVAGMPEAQFKVQSAFGQQTHFATDANAVLPFVQAHDIVCHFVPPRQSKYLNKRERPSEG